LPADLAFIGDVHLDQDDALLEPFRPDRFDTT